MSADFSSALLCEDLSPERLELNQYLEKMTEQMENISVKLSLMAYDMVVLRTSLDLDESLKRLQIEFLKCKAVICGPKDEQDLKCHPGAEDNNIHQE